MYGHIIRVRNVNHALPEGLSLLTSQGQKVSSRGMETVEAPGPVSTVYSHPRERVLFDPVRDANPFFHLIEALWIIGGSNRVALPKMFMDNIDRFSDDGVTFHGAYGERLRHDHGFDQINVAIETLRAKPDSRQVVMSIWNPLTDLGDPSKDIPCNDMVMLKVRFGALNMTVCNRSNDMIWGAYGANVVQFSMLQEYMAAAIGVDVGYYTQQSDSFHAYTDNPFWKNCETGYWPESGSEYAAGFVAPYPMCSSSADATVFAQDCRLLCKTAERHGAKLNDLSRAAYASDYFNEVVSVVIGAYLAYKRKQYGTARDILSTIPATDWRLAMTQWVQRRYDRAQQKEQA